ncbi:MAG: CinA family nicotinamide mononucleotide deamidase-related protein [Chlamydiota bacterium]
MDIEIVAIGDEILAGAVVNTNAAFIGSRLLEVGYKVARQATFSDDPEAIKQNLKEAMGRSALVIATGGLGPTCDDLTRDVACALFSSEMHLDERIAQDLKNRFGSLPISLENQATVPVKAKVLMNTIGTAPGLVFEEKGSTLILLPGVPQEMRTMLERDVLPYILKYHPLKEKTVQKKLSFSLLTEGQVDPFLRILEKDHPEVQFGIYPGYGILTVACTSKKETEIEKAITALYTHFQDHYVASPSGKLEEAVALLLTDKKKTLALAESMTGGLMAAQLTAMAGASDYLIGSCVVYSNAMKTVVLHVSEKTLKDHGAVSEEVVREMLQGLLKVTDADYGIAVTGIAGPSGAVINKPIGTVWGAVGARGKEPFVEQFLARGTREMILLYACRRLFANLLTYCKNS